MQAGLLRAEGPQCPVERGAPSSWPHPQAAAPFQGVGHGQNKVVTWLYLMMRTTRTQGVRTQVKPIKKEKWDLAVQRWVCGGLDQVTQVLKVEVSSNTRPGFPPNVLSLPKTNFNGNIRQCTGTEKGRTRPLELIAAQNHCTQKVQRKTIGTISGFENL